MHSLAVSASVACTGSTRLKQGRKQDAVSLITARRSLSRLLSAHVEVAHWRVQHLLTLPDTHISTKRYPITRYRCHCCRRASSPSPMLIPIRLPAVASTNQGSSGSPNTPAAAGSDSATAASAVPVAAPDEWSLIELNGTLNCTGGANHAATGEGLGGLPLGQLSFPAPDKVRK